MQDGVLQAPLLRVRIAVIARVSGKVPAPQTKLDPEAAWAPSPRFSMNDLEKFCGMQRLLIVSSATASMTPSQIGENFHSAVSSRVHLYQTRRHQEDHAVRISMNMMCENGS